MNTERKLARTEIIKDITPIEGADRIEVAHVKGWQVVVEKGLYNPGDMVIYFEIDSVLPEWPEFEFLRERCYTDKSVNGPGFRIKTIKLRGVVSQGMIMPIADVIHHLVWSDIKEPDTDLTEQLGVTKFERALPATLAGTVRGNFPNFIIKTDQERIQNVWEKISKYYRQITTFEVTTKLDGASMTVYYLRDNDHFGVCSRNLELADDAKNSYWQAAHIYELKTKLQKLAGLLDCDVAVQGELMGPGIQGNREGFKTLRFFAFDIYDITGQVYLSAYNRRKYLEMVDIEQVPVLDKEFSIFGLELEDLLRFAEETKSIGNPIAEGVVFRANHYPTVSFKVISNKYLLKGGE